MGRGLPRCLFCRAGGRHKGGREAVLVGVCRLEMQNAPTQSPERRALAGVVRAGRQWLKRRLPAYKLNFSFVESFIWFVLVENEP